MSKPVKYIIENPRDALWGLTITTVGYEKIRPGDPYPTDCHLDSHSFSPGKGRVLQEYQLVYITEGCGTFESAEFGRTKIKPGTMFLLFPDEWHTYCPDKQVGWTQYWIGFKGVNMDERVRQEFFSKKDPIFEVGLTEELVNLFMKAIETTDQERSHFQQMLAGIVNYMLGLIYMLDKNNRLDQDRHWIDQISRARILMHENIESCLTVQDIAEKVGAGYSSFRKNFKKYTGLSPASYFQDLKLQRAKDLLCLTDLSVKEIAYRLNFESPDYFSAQFRKKTGKRPSDFRN
ncbi:MAG: AraC family transcriptional regulator [Muribaculaceae bacterium]|nr:AraC family transcriptional regulator [Muribaculaceae bacterium]